MVSDPHDARVLSAPPVCVTVPTPVLCLPTNADHAMFKLPPLRLSTPLSASPTSRSPKPWLIVPPDMVIVPCPPGLFPRTIQPDLLTKPLVMFSVPLP